MNHASLAFLFASLTCLPAQIVETIGGTTTTSTLANRAKANQIRVDTTVLLLEFEMQLNVPAPDTLTFFAYRSNSRTGVGTLQWTLPVAVAGGTGPGWYSSGPIALPLVAGNYYALGVSWSGSVTYNYSTSSAPISFGAWQRAHTLNNPLPATLAFAGSDAAQYYQRFTSIATPTVVPVGTGCSSTALVPRLVADSVFQLNTTTNLELVDTAPSSIVLFALANGLTVGTPLPLFGCSIWLDLSGPLVTLAAISSPAGYTSLPVPVANNPGLLGTAYSAQGLVFGNAIDISNAVGFVIN